MTCRRCGRAFVAVGPARETAAPAAATDTRLGSMPTAAPPGSVPRQIGRFEVHCLLGEGAFGAVYRAYDCILEREVALKVPQAAILGNREAKLRFLRESKAAAQLRHPHIVPLYDAGKQGDCYYIASAFIEGETLESLIDDQRPEFQETARLVRSLAEALHYAHRIGVVHRDVKPANIMIDDQRQAMLTDFGLARVESVQEKLTRDGAVMGTPAYMAPEQADGALGEVGPASDQYSLGVVLYEMLCGETPFSGPPAILLFNTVHQTPDPPRKRNPKVPRDLETICLKAIAKRPVERFADCGELAEDLRRWLDDEPIRARRLSVAERAMRWARRNPVLAGLTVAVLALAVVTSCATFGLLQSRQRLKIALDNEQAQTSRAQQQSTLAKQQSALAKQQSALAKTNEQRALEQERLAIESLAKLQAEVAARNKAEAERAAEEKRRMELAQNLERTEGEVKLRTAAAEQARRDAEKAEQERQSALARAPWFKYTANLAAADDAYRSGGDADAHPFLEQCPQEHRGWEWDFLRDLSRFREVDVVSREIGAGETGFSGAWCGASGENLWVLLQQWNPNDRSGIRSPALLCLTGKLLPRAVNVPYSMGFVSPNGKAIFAKIAVNRSNGKWQLMDLENAQTRGTSIGISPLLETRTPFSPDGRYLVGVIQDRIVRIVSTENSREYQDLSAVARGAPGSALAVGFSRRGERMAVYQDEARPCFHFCKIEGNGLKLLAPFTVEPVAQTPLGDQAGGIEFSLDDKKLAVIPASGGAGIYDATSCQLLCMIPDKYRFLGFSPDGKRAALAQGAKLVLMDLATQQELPQLACIAGLLSYTLNSDWTCGVKIVARHELRYFTRQPAP